MIRFYRNFAKKLVDVLRINIGLMAFRFFTVSPFQDSSHVITELVKGIIVTIGPTITEIG